MKNFVWAKVKLAQAKRERRSRKSLFINQPKTLLKARSSYITKNGVQISSLTRFVSSFKTLFVVLRNTFFAWFLFRKNMATPCAIRRENGMPFSTRALLKNHCSLPIHLMIPKHSHRVLFQWVTVIIFKKVLWSIRGFGSYG